MEILCDSLRSSRLCVEKQVSDSAPTDQEMVSLHERHGGLPFRAVNSDDYSSMMSFSLAAAVSLTCFSYLRVNSWTWSLVSSR